MFDLHNYVIIDLDGTLCDSSQRFHWAQAKEWDKFHEGIADDEVNHDVCEFMKCMSSVYNIILCTGRDEKHRRATESWLIKKNIDHCVDLLLMRPEGDNGSDADVKIKLLEKHFGSKEEVLSQVLFSLDDRDSVVEAFRNYGIPCWQVNAGEY